MTPTKQFRQDFVAGLTTFLTMSYIIVVNPSILSTNGTGMAFSGVLSATVIVATVSSILMGMYAKLPFALAPGMGINAFFTFSLVLGEGVSWQQALGLTFWSGIIFVIISITGVRELLIKAIPSHLKLALCSGIGLFLCFIGLKNAGMVVADPATFVRSGPISGAVMCTVIGIMVIVLMARKRKDLAFLAGIIASTIASVSLGLTKAPTEIISSPDLHSVAFQADIFGALKLSLLAPLFSLILTDLFDSLSTFVAVSEGTGLLEGRPKRLKRALLVDAIATTISGPLGTSAATTFIESASGVNAGGRSGRVSVITGLLFLPFLFLSPLIQVIPSHATAPVLIVVGIMMASQVTKLTHQDWDLMIPAYLTVVMIPLTFSITQGVLWGLSSTLVLKVVSGKAPTIPEGVVGLLAIVAMTLG